MRLSREKWTQVPILAFFRACCRLNLRKLDSQHTFIFQQDNDSRHTFNLKNGGFEARNIKAQPWPAQSSEMKSIENLWCILKDRVTEKSSQNVKELRIKIEEVWMEMPAYGLKTFPDL